MSDIGAYQWGTFNWRRPGAEGAALPDVVVWVNRDDPWDKPAHAGPQDMSWGEWREAVLLLGGEWRMTVLPHLPGPAVDASPAPPPSSP